MNNKEAREQIVSIVTLIVIGAIFGFVLGVVADAAWNSHQAKKTAHTASVPVTPGVKKVSEPRSKRCLVDKVIDAVTVRANCDGSGMTVIRQIGVRIPKGRECYANKVAAHAQSEMPHNSAIEIYQDKTYEPKTTEGYTNAYIVTRPDELTLTWDDYEWGRWVIKGGEADAIASTATPYLQQSTYVEAQDYAKQYSLGKWGACTW